MNNKKEQLLVVLTFHAPVSRIGLAINGKVAQVVEHRIHKPAVGSASLPLATTVEFDLSASPKDAAGRRRYCVLRSYLRKEDFDFQSLYEAN